MMKFPKSVHAEGFYDHIDTTATVPREVQGERKPGLKHSIRPGARPLTSNGPLLREPMVAVTPPTVAPPFSAAPTATRTSTSAAAHAADPASRANPTPWIFGAGVGIVLIGLAVMMSRGLPSQGISKPPVTVVGQASPSPQDAQLQSEPPAAGTVTPVPEVAAPETLPAEKSAPVAEPRVAAAPVPEVTAPAPAIAEPAPVTKRLMAQPEVMAQAPASAQLREPALLPLAPPVTMLTPSPSPATPAPTVTPPEAAPMTPLLAQQTPPATPDPEDSGITVKVRLALATDATLAAVPIAVSTDHGVVKLEGQAPDALARERATVVASATAGVKAVDNRLTLPPVASLDRAPSNGG